MYSVTGNTTSLVLGFPIRTSSDQSSVDSSPRLIAASNVLHRLPVPRHPPCALKHLQHKKPDTEKRNYTTTNHTPRMNQTIHTRLTPTPEGIEYPCGLMLATTIHKSNTTPHHQDGATTRNHPAETGGGPQPHPNGQAVNPGPVASGPNSVSGGTSRLPAELDKSVCRAPTRSPLQTPG